MTGPLVAIHLSPLAFRARPITCSATACARSQELTVSRCISMLSIWVKRMISTSDSSLENKSDEFETVRATKSGCGILMARPLTIRIVKGWPPWRTFLMSSGVTARSKADFATVASQRRSALYLNPLAFRARPITCSATARARSAPSRNTAST